MLIDQRPFPYVKTSVTSYMYIASKNNKKKMDRDQDSDLSSKRLRTQRESLEQHQHTLRKKLEEMGGRLQTRQEIGNKRSVNSESRLQIKDSLRKQREGLSLDPL